MNRIFDLFCFVLYRIMRVFETPIFVSGEHTPKKTCSLFMVFFDMNDWIQYVCQHDGMVETAIS